MEKTTCTLCLYIDNGRILLGMKKVGFGQGKYNGFGGKVDEKESIEEAARREMTEECGLSVSDLEPAGVLEFHWPKRTPPRIITTHIFVVKRCTGRLAESDEMRPEWFDIPHIPYERMWPDDRAWLPLLLAGQKFRGTFHFGAKDDIIHEELTPVAAL